MARKFSDFPKCVKRFLMSDEVLSGYARLAGDFGLSEKQADAALDILARAESSEIFAADLPEAIAKETGLGEEKAKKIAIAMAGNTLLVLSDFLGQNVEALVKKWGGDMDNFKDQTRKRYEMRKGLQKELGPEEPVVPLSEDLSPEEKKAEMIGRVAELEFENENLRKRFRNIAISFFKGVRTSDQVRDMLSRPVKIGGMGYGEEDAMKASIAMEEAVKMEEEGRPAKKKKARPKGNAVAEREKRSRVKSEERGRIEPESKAPSQGEAALETEKNNEPLSSKKEKAETLQGKGGAKPKESKEPALQLESPEIPDALPAKAGQPTAKDSLSEEKKERQATEMPRIGKNEQLVDKEPVAALRPEKKEEPEETGGRMDLLDPVEEIEETKMVDFRRLSEDPAKAAEKILQKIDLLKEDSILIKLKGIKAWQKSEVYQLYIDIGYEIILKGQPLEDVIRERKEKGIPCMTKEEYYAVVDFNSRLKI